MSPSGRVRALWALALVLLAACQGYEFNPVGHCTFYGDRTTETLSNVSTADILFVVDDSGSMEAEQISLASNFNAFIQTLDRVNADRVAMGPSSSSGRCLPGTR